jgi:DNA-binding transcriptional ArsR family regulator
MNHQDIFQVLAEPRRREIIELLASHGQMSASDISDQFNITSAAISQHLKVLREAELVKMEKHAQQRLYQINPTAFDELENWSQRMKSLWNQRLDRLEALLASKDGKLAPVFNTFNGRYTYQELRLARLVM